MDFVLCFLVSYILKYAESELEILVWFGSVLYLLSCDSNKGDAVQEQSRFFAFER